MIPLPRACTCGRLWVHCKACGGKSVYCLGKESEGHTRSAIMSGKIKQGDQIRVFRCKGCNHISYYPYNPYFEGTENCTAASAEDLARLNRMYKGDIEVEPSVTKRHPSADQNESNKPKESPITQETISLAELIQSGMSDSDEDKKGD